MKMINGCHKMLIKVPRALVSSKRQGLKAIFYSVGKFANLEPAGFSEQMKLLLILRYSVVTMHLLSVVPVSHVKVTSICLPQFHLVLSNLNRRRSSALYTVLK